METSWRLEVGREVQDGVAVLTVSGRIGAESAARLTDALTRAIAEGHRRVLVDLAGVDYLSSAGLMVLDAAAGRLFGSGGVLALCSVREPVRLVLEMAGLSGDLPVHDSRAEGVARLARPD